MSLRARAGAGAVLFLGVALGALAWGVLDPGEPGPVDRGVGGGPVEDQRAGAGRGRAAAIPPRFEPSATDAAQAGPHGSGAGALARRLPPASDASSRKEVESVSELALRLRASDVAERAAAAAALGRRGPASAAAVPALLEALRDGRAPATAFSWALGQVGAPAVPALADALRDEDEELRSRAIDALVVIGAAAREELLRALRAPGAEARAAAALALARMAPAPEVTRELLLAARDPDEAVRHHAALGLARVGAEDWPAVEAASRSLAREERQVALAASAQRSGWGDAPAADLASAREGGDEAEAAAPHRRR